MGAWGIASNAFFTLQAQKFGVGRGSDHNGGVRVVGVRQAKLGMDY